MLCIKNSAVFGALNVITDLNYTSGLEPWIYPFDWKVNAAAPKERVSKRSPIIASDSVMNKVTNVPRERII